MAKKKGLDRGELEKIFKKISTMNKHVIDSEIKGLDEHSLKKDFLKMNEMIKRDRVFSRVSGEKDC